MSSSLITYPPNSDFPLLTLLACRSQGTGAEQKTEKRWRLTGVPALTLVSITHVSTGTTRLSVHPEIPLAGPKASYRQMGMHSICPTQASGGEERIRAVTEGDLHWHVETLTNLTIPTALKYWTLVEEDLRSEVRDGFEALTENASGALLAMFDGNICSLASPSTSPSQVMLKNAHDRTYLGAKQNDSWNWYPIRPNGST